MQDEYCTRHHVHPARQVPELYAPELWYAMDTGSRPGTKETGHTGEANDVIKVKVPGCKLQDPITKFQERGAIHKKTKAACSGLYLLLFMFSTILRL